MSSDEDDGQLAPFTSNAPLQFGSVHTGETHVCDDTRHARQSAGQQKRFRGFEGDGFVSGGFEDALNRLSNTTIVVDGCDNQIRPPHQDHPSACPAWYASARADVYYRFI